MELTGSQFEQLEQALEKAFPDKVKLRRMIRVTFNEKLQMLAEGDNHRERVDNTIDWAENQSCVGALVRGAHCRNPSNAQLKKFCKQTFKALLEEAVSDNVTDFSTEMIQQLASAVLRKGIDFAQIEAAAVLSLPPGASDDPEDRDYADFQANELLPEMRLIGFLRFAVVKFPTSFNQPTLLAFANALSDKLGAGTVSKPLQSWIQKAEPTAVDAMPVGIHSGIPDKPSGTLQVALMVTVEKLISPRNSKKPYRIQGYLYFDQIVGRVQPCLEPRPLLRLELSEMASSIGIECAWAEVEAYNDKFLSQAISQLRQLKRELHYRSYQLAVEIFLPLEKIGVAVDQWQRSEPRSEPLGVGQGVIVRFLERMHDPERENALIESWDRLQAHLQPPHSLQTLEEHVESPESFDKYSSWRQLENSLRDQLGLKLCCGLPDTDKDKQKLFQTLLYSDVPFAVWTRRADLLTHDDEAEAALDVSVALQPFLMTDSFKDLAVLARKLTDVRRQAWSEEGNLKEGRCLGDHMAVLLDNPDRLPVPPLLS